MSTVASWTELRRSSADLAALLRFRRSGLARRSRRRLQLAALLVLAITVGVVVVAAYLPGSLTREHPGRVLALLPSAYLGFLLLTIMSATASGGGREVIPREQAVAFPVSTTTEHLGALLLAPLNIAWLVQSWTLLGAAAYALGPHNLLASELPVLLWIVAATTIAQAVGWLLEWLRRGPHGIVLARLVMLGFGLLVALLILTDQLGHVLDNSPTLRIMLISAQVSGGAWTDWSVGIAILAAIVLAAVVAGAFTARCALSRPEREELRLESGHRAARPNPTSALVAMLRIDRAAVWRSVPLRRGLSVLAVMPGIVALAGHLEWKMLTILPGLVASGVALLFGVNSWCLDGRGALWRDSLPGSPRTAFWSRVIVLLEVLVGAAAVTVLLGALRAGTPTVPELVAMACATVVVSGQVVSAALRWSVNRPFAVDMRSARATPAPPVVMAGYSARLAVSTTLTGLVFSGLATLSTWQPSVLVALPLLLISAYRLVRTSARWDVPETRARVIAVVAS